MASRSGSKVFSAKLQGVKELDAFFKTTICAEDLNVAKGELRQATKKIANEILIPALKEGAAGSGVPQAPKMADTMRTRTDRLVTVRVGAVNPKLSGFKRGKGAKKTDAQGGKSSQSYRTTLAWGSDRGPYPGAAVNHYGVARRDAGYWVLRTTMLPKNFDAVKAAYQDVLDRLFRDYGRYR